MRDAVEWQFNGIAYEPDAEDLPDGTNPHELQLAWTPWIVACLDCLDGKGTQRHFYEPGSYGDQPARDLLIFRIIRGKWIELTNERMIREAKA